MWNALSAKSPFLTPDSLILPALRLCHQACAVRKGNEKGRVENGVGYVKKNFLSGLELELSREYEALNPAIRRWLDEIANVRIHGETRKKPIDCLPEDLQEMRVLNKTNSYDIARIETARSKQAVSDRTG